MRLAVVGAMVSPMSAFASSQRQQYGSNRRMIWFWYYLGWLLYITLLAAMFVGAALWYHYATDARKDTQALFEGEESQL